MCEHYMQCAVMGNILRDIERRNHDISRVALCYYMYLHARIIGDMHYLLNEWLRPFPHRINIALITKAVLASVENIGFKVNTVQHVLNSILCYHMLFRVCISGTLDESTRFVFMQTLVDIIFVFVKWYWNRIPICRTTFTVYMHYSIDV